MTSSNVVLSVLAFLGTAGLLCLAGAGALLGLFRGNRVVVRRCLLGGAALAGGYGLALVGTSLATPERVLPAGSEKYFCELDCHLAYSVVGVEPLRSAEGGNTTWLLRLRTRFDENTISPRRGDAPLHPNPRKITVRGSDGRWYPESAELAAALSEPSTPLSQALRPGESYLTALTFVLPAGVRPFGLEVAEDLVVNRVLIGHEQSFLHRPVLLGMGS